jgi:putative phosphoesterase
MRIAVVTDVHGNLSALEAVIADLTRVAPDVVVHGGDLVAMGHRPADVLDRVRERGWPGIQGNTDEMLWRPELFDRFMTGAPQLAHIWTMVFQQQGPATRERLGADRIEWLRQLPTEWRDDDLAVVHATPGNLWQSPIADASDADLATAYAPLGRRIAAYGHIHVPFVRRIDGIDRELIVANCGSVGMPFDGDPRASYLIVDDGVPATRHVEYDVEGEVKGLLQSGYPDAGRLAEALRTGRFIMPPKPDTN